MATNFGNVLGGNSLDEWFSSTSTTPSQGYSPEAIKYLTPANRIADRRTGLGDDFQLFSPYSSGGSAWTGRNTVYKAFDPYGNWTGQYTTVGDQGIRGGLTSAAEAAALMAAIAYGGNALTGAGGGAGTGTLGTIAPGAAQVAPLETLGTATLPSAAGALPTVGAGLGTTEAAALGAGAAGAGGLGTTGVTGLGTNIAGGTGLTAPAGGASMLGTSTAGAGTTLGTAGSGLGTGSTMASQFATGLGSTGLGTSGALGIADYIKLGANALGIYKGLAGGASGGKVQTSADPFSPYRPGIASLYNQYLTPGGTVDPSQLPGYSQWKTGVLDPALSSVQGKMAASGLSLSGAEQAGLMRTGEQGYYNFMTDYMNRLAQGSGASTSPYSAAALGQQADLANQQSFMQGLGGLAQAAPSIVDAWNKWSDIRLKENIVKLGTRPDGLNVYEFNYIWGGPRCVGLMAQEVQQLYPHAVKTGTNGFFMVNYSEV